MQSIHLTSFLSPSSPFTTLSPISSPLPVPRESEYLLRITHISPQQVDLLYARGKHQNNNPKRGHIHPPFTLGLDFSGTVLRSPRTPGEHLPPGTQVFGTHLGAFATHLCAPRSAIQPVPKGLSQRDAASLASGAVSYACLPPLRKGQWILVTGAPGFLALATAQLARARGAEVVLLTRNEMRCRAVAELDVCEGMHVLASDGDWRTQVTRLTKGKGVDVVIDHVGLVADCLRTLAYGGTIVVVGFAGREGVMERLPMDRVLLRGAKVVGFRFGEGARKGVLDAQKCWEEYLECLAQGEVRPVVDRRRYSGLQSIGRAMQDLADGVPVGKAVVDVDADDNNEHRQAAKL
ncbi:hypothetical protein ANO11243_064830 [Dothideomycetidae sp. 11243]|nr:hypothetical protein ANO11243_064830 [fungal sp. No.11243]